MPPRRTLLLLCALFVWFNAGVEEWRLGHWGEIAEHPARILWPPWQPLRAYVSRESDERLYFQYSRLILGEEPDLDYLARKRQGDPEKNRRELAPLIRQGPGMRMPYRDFPLEYPPLPVALMLLPRLVASSLAAYRVAFGAQMALVFLLLALVAGRLGETAQVWKRMGWLALAIGPILCSRLDLLPALLVAAALLALDRRRDVLCGALFGLAILAKLYPALLMLPLIALLRRRSLKIAAAAAVTGLLASLPFLVAAPRAFLQSVALYGARPFQIESLPGGLILALRGKEAVIGSFGSYNAATPPALAALADVLFWGSLAALAAAAALRGGQVKRWMAAVLALILCTSKVLSPQYLIWLLPFPALLPDLFRWSIVACALTQAYYPFLYDPLLDAQPLVVLVLLLRNAALVVLAVRAVRGASAPAVAPGMV